VSTKPPRPYFEREAPEPRESAAPDVIFIQFLARLDGAAQVQIDQHQEMLIMQLRQRCLKYALSPDSDVIVAALNQLCAVYQQAAIQVGLKSFDVFRVLHEEYVDVQEQLFLSRRQTEAKEQRPVQLTTNLLNYAHELLEGALRRISSLGLFSLDVLRGGARARVLSAAQYLDLALRDKDEGFSQHPNILRATHELLFGAVNHNIRNSIAHRRYEIQEDGSVLLYDFRPNSKQRLDLGKLTQPELTSLTGALETSIDVFSISLLIFQHNHGGMLHQLGYYERKREYSDKQMVEMLHVEAPAAFLRVEDVSCDGETLLITVRYVGHDRAKGGVAYVSSKDKDGRPVRYALPIPARELSARDQTLRFLQKSSFYARRFKQVVAHTKGQDGEIIGEVTAPMDLLIESTEREIPIAEFLARLVANTFPAV
jgi:hypothetical protein